VVAVLEETISGTTAGAERTGLQAVRDLVEAGTVKKVLVHEVSRLSRRPSVVHSFVEELEQAGVSLYWHAQRIETMLVSGKRNPAAAIMLALLAEMARAETDTLRDRIKSGLDAARRKGVTLGRKPGSTTPTAAFLARHKDIVKLLKDGQSVRHTAAITGKGGSTVQRVKAALAAA
jgi:DNA invertase Pin-like site-specific DNA recombinase